MSENPVVLLETTSGDILVELYPDKAPETVANFLKYVDDGFYNNTIFHRVIPGFMIQGGDPEGTGMGGPGYCIKGEFAMNGSGRTTAAPSPWPEPWIPTAPRPSSSSISLTTTS